MFEGNRCQFKLFNAYLKFGYFKKHENINTHLLFIHCGIGKDQKQITKTAVGKTNMLCHMSNITSASA